MYLQFKLNKVYLLPFKHLMKITFLETGAILERTQSRETQI